MNINTIESRILDKIPNAQVTALDPTNSGNHFELHITSSELMTLPRFKRHQTIMDIFQNELKSGEIHALTLEFTT